MNDTVVVETRNPDPILTIAVQTPAAVTLLTPAEAALERARAFEIATQEDVEIATAEAQSAKRRWDAIEDQRVDLKRPIDEAAKRIQDLFRKPLETWKSVGDVYRQKIGAWTVEQQRIAREAQAKAEEAARKERERLEREAAKAEAAGKIEVAEAKRERAELLEQAPVVVPEPESVAGVSVATTYDAELVNILELAKFVARNPMYANLLQLDTANARRLAQAMRDSFSIPGLKLVKKASTRIRK